MKAIPSTFFLYSLISYKQRNQESSLLFPKILIPRLIILIITYLPLSFCFQPFAPQTNPKVDHLPTATIRIATLWCNSGDTPTVEVHKSPHVRCWCATTFQAAYGNKTQQVSVLCCAQELCATILVHRLRHRQIICQLTKLCTLFLSILCNIIVLVLVWFAE